MVLSSIGLKPDTEPPRLDRQCYAKLWLIDLQRRQS